MGYNIEGYRRPRAGATVSIFTGRWPHLMTPEAASAMAKELLDAADKAETDGTVPHLTADLQVVRRTA